MPQMEGRAATGLMILTLAFHREGRLWVGNCLELGTSTYARTLEQTQRELIEMVECHLNTLEEVGERDRFFREHGIEYHTEEKPPTRVRPSLPLDGKSFVQPRQFPVPAHAPVRRPTHSQPSPDSRKDLAASIDRHGLK